MPFLWVQADDEPGKNSIRKTIEANAISLLSRASLTGDQADPQSPTWLGHYSNPQHSVISRVLIHNAATARRRGGYQDQPL